MRDSPTTQRLTVTLNDKTIHKLEKVKALKKISTEQAIVYGVDLVLIQYEQSLLNNRNSFKTPKSKKKCENKKLRKPKIGSTPKKRSRYITTAAKKQVVIRALQQCEFPGCDETKYLEFEHIKPFAKGGDNSPKNLKLFCKTHNQRAAINEFGLDYMNRFIN